MSISFLRRGHGLNPQMLVNYSLIFTALVLFAGLATDAGMLERNYLLLQGAANAAATAATVSLQRAAGGLPTGTASAASITAATAAGKAAASANGFTDGVNGVAVTITITAISYSYSSTITAKITESVAPGFLGILGMGKMNMQAQTAQVEGVPVNLSSFFNVIGIYTDGHTIPSNGGFGGNGYGLSGTLLGSVRASNGLGAILSWRGQIFSLFPANAANGVSNTTVNLPKSMPYSQLLIIASTVWAYASPFTGTFVVTYTDGSTASSSFQMSDWCDPQYYTGESMVSMQTYRLHNTALDYAYPNYIYGYSINVDKTKNLSTLKLPTMSNAVVFAIDVMP